MKPLTAKTIILIAATALSISATANNSHKKHSAKPSSAYHYAERAEAMRFADDLAERRGLAREWVRQALGQARLLREVPRLVLPPPKGVAKNWAAYRARFVEPTRIRAGLRFWQDNAEALARAEREYGVPAEIIVGIIGVETLYGQHMGGLRVIDALATLSFDFPDAHPRAAERRA
ncbi:MAG: lytic murein transglycosylase, partial [Proteobacteria bacterium]|nr:lytic murein transglycosylase [Pseudomonadota bacterium]